VPAIAGRLHAVAHKGGRRWERPRTGLDVVSEPAGGCVFNWKLGAEQVESAGDSETPEMSEQFKLALTSAQARVLFDWLAREGVAFPAAHQAEQDVP